MEEKKNNLDAIANDNNSIIIDAIDSFLYKCYDIEFAIQNLKKTTVHSIKNKLDECKNNIEMLKIHKDINKMLPQSYHSMCLEIQRWVKTDMLRLVDSGLFMSLFAAYEKFTGDLLKAIFKKSPKYFHISQSIPISTLIEENNIDKIINIALDKEIEQIRRKNYPDQFKDFEKRFGLKLTKFKNWPLFVERGQRRNLIAHCDGIVNEQYIQMCKSANDNQDIPLQDIPVQDIGTRLDFSDNYLLESCNLLFEIAFKLGQTLCRKLFPEEIDSLNRHIVDVQFDRLNRDDWKKAQIIGEFAMGLQNPIDGDIKYYIIINYLQSLKWDNNQAKLNIELNKIKSTSLLLEFQLAFCLLRDQMSDALQLMERIGKTSTLYNEQAYCTWPIFREFRKMNEFQEKLLSIFNVKITDVITVEDLEKELINN